MAQDGTLYPHVETAAVSFDFDFDFDYWSSFIKTTFTSPPRHRDGTSNEILGAIKSARPHKGQLTFAHSTRETSAALNCSILRWVAGQQQLRLPERANQQRSV